MELLRVGCQCHECVSDRLAEGDTEEEIAAVAVSSPTFGKGRE